jgi:hypothetical protein
MFRAAKLLFRQQPDKNISLLPRDHIERRYPSTSREMAPVVAFPISQECLPLLDRAWDEVKNSVSNEPPTEGSLVLFDPSKTCKVLIDWVHGEVGQIQDLLYANSDYICGFRLPRKMIPRKVPTRSLGDTFFSPNYRSLEERHLGQLFL